MNFTRWDVYLAACIGALIATFADLLWRPANAMSVRIGEMLSQAFGITIDASWPILVLALLLAIAVTFVNQPVARADGFARGLAVFAVLSLPPSPVQQQASADMVFGRATERGFASSFGFLGIRRAYAQFGGSVSGGDALDMEDSSAGPEGQPDRRLWSKKYKTVSPIVRFQPAGNDRNSVPATIVLKNLSNGKSTRLKWNLRRPMVVSGPQGSYGIEVIASGYRRTRTDIRIDGTARIYDVKLNRSRFPLGIQQLVGPKRVAPDTKTNAKAIDEALKKLLRK